MGQVGGVDRNYLTQAAALVNSAKQLSYEWMALQPDMQVLDVGCGPGIDTVELARRVPRGQVKGVDRDPVMIHDADELARAAGVLERVEHVEADATSLPFPDASFHAVRSERLFQHLTDPAAALAEMVRVTRPGGRVVVLDTDWGSHSVDSPDVRVERALAHTLAETSLANGYSGRRLYGLVRRAGLRDVEVSVLPVMVTDHTLWRVIARLDQVEKDAVAARSVSEAALDRWRTTMERDAETFFGAVNMILVAGTKPDC